MTVSRRPHAGSAGTPRLFSALEFGQPFDLVPHGWKTICLLDFPTGLPSLVERLPVIEDWYGSLPDREVVLCSNETWAALVVT